MSKLFNRALLFTDLHYGAKSNSSLHNEDCLAFIKWMITVSKEHDCDTCIFLGDYHNNRAAMNLKTMHYAVQSLELISAHFKQTYFILGNHDLFFKDRRDIHSAPWAKHIPNVTVIYEPTRIGEVTFCPWLVGNEWKSMARRKGQYVFGHFELPHFYMNAMIKMPDYGEIQLSTFKNFEMGFSGHFHKRQHQENMHYIGNAFPHNYADAWDDDRGVAILEWGSQPLYITWPDQPTFRTLKLSQLIDDSATIIRPNQHLRVTLDIDISFEEANFIKETFMQNSGIRELTLVAEKSTLDQELSTEVQKFESVDQLVLAGLTNIESTAYDAKLLMELYNNL